MFVTITVDEHVNKGPNRPVNNHYFRAKILQSLKQVDYVGINETNDAVKGILSIKPDYYFKGKDYKGKKDLTQRLDTLSPLATLKRGYSITTYGGKEGKIVRNANSLKKNDVIDVRFSSGIISANVKDIHDS